jgi:uncharacterized protein (TIGR03067 family)
LVNVHGQIRFPRRPVSFGPRIASVSIDRRLEISGGRTMKTLITVAVMLFAANSFAAEPAVAVGKEPALDRPAGGFPDLAGTYKIIASEKEGLATPEEKIEGVIVVFTSDKIVATDRDKKEVYSASYKIDATQLPAMISLVSTMPDSKGVTAKGLIEANKEKVRLIYTLPDGKVMPTEFKTIGRQVMVTLERIEPLAKAIEDKVPDLK